MALGLFRHEHMLLVGLSAAAVGLVVGMRTILQRFRDSNAVEPVKPKTQYITQETEDSLPMSTLASLLEHYNYSIRDTAVKIVCDRAVNDERTLQVLLHGITNVDYEERMKNLRALAMLTDQNTLHLLNTPRAYAAFVRSLELCTWEVQYGMLDDVYFDEYYLRDISEKLCLMFVMQLTSKYGMDELVRAQFVERWLAKQRWGDSEKECRDNFARYLVCRDNRISDICRRLRQSPAGRAALERANLMPPPPPPPPQQQHPDPPETPTTAVPDRDGQPAQSNGAPDYLLEALTDVVLQPGDRLLMRGQLGDLGDLVFATAAAQDQDPGTISNTRERAGDAVLLDIDVDRLTPQGGANGDQPMVRLTHDDMEALRGSYILRMLDHDGGDGGDGGGGSGHRRRRTRTRDDPSSPSPGRQTRPHSQSTQEEQRIRRQHREAMVLNDGTRPLGRSDIIERESD